MWFPVRLRLSLLVLFGLLIAVLTFLARQGNAAGPLSSQDFAALAYKIAVVAFVAGTVLTLFRERFTRAITAGALWVLFGLILVAAYSYRFELQEIGERML